MGPALLLCKPIDCHVLKFFAAAGKLTDALNPDVLHAHLDIGETGHGFCGTPTTAAMGAAADILRTVKYTCPDALFL